MKETWKDIRGTDGRYQVNTNGDVKSYAKSIEGRCVAPTCDWKGYLKIGIWYNGKRRSMRIARLVAETFIPNPFNLRQVNHIDGIKTNNIVENLEWCSCLQNVRHAIESGLHKGNPNPVRGAKHYFAKLSEGDVRHIRKLVREGEIRHADIAERYGISRQHVCDIGRGKKWGWLKEGETT